ncbi:MAG: hypothetical protein JKY56_09220 [Kofleriaceae bacterium]|nr:hypothetical protein [Kofleriaceae bacterium]
MITPFRLALLSCIALAACDENTKIIDPFPIQIDQSSGAVLLAAGDDAESALAIVVDVLSPITILDSYRDGQELATPQRRLSDLNLFAFTDGQVGARRVRFSNTTSYDLHPCDVAGTSPQACKVGQDSDTKNVFGVLGADLLSRTSVRFNFSQGTMRFFPDAAGSETERTLACDAVFRDPYGGGGTLQIGGSEVRYSSLRPTLGVCIHHQSLPELLTDSREIGTDLHMAISTAIGITLLTEDAYLRFSRDSDSVPALADLPTTVVHTPSGQIDARLGQIDYLALAGNVGADSNGRGPCREVYANARMRVPRSCADSQVDCPCPNSEQSCKAGAIIEVAKPIAVAIVPANIDILQGLRDELRPRVPEIDGIVGVNALSDIQVEFDFPNSRMLLRCEQLDNCITRPQVRSQNFLTALDECRALEQMERQSTGPDEPPIP